MGLCKETLALAKGVKGGVEKAEEGFAQEGGLRW